MGVLTKAKLLQIFSNHHHPDLPVSEGLINELLLVSNEASISSKAMDFGEILSKMLEGIQIIDFDWKYLYVNDTAVKQSRYSKDELFGNTMQNLYPGIEKTELFSNLNKCMHEKIVKNCVNKFEYPDGKIGWFELSIQPIPEGILVLSIDITDKKEAELQLQISENEYRSLIEQATDGICISDKNGNYIEANESACKMMGYSRNEFLELNIVDLLLHEEKEINPPKFNELREGKTILSVRKLKAKDNRIVDAEINSKMLPNGNFLGIVRDITERVKLEEKNAFFASIVNSSDDAIVSKTLEGIVLTWNFGAENIFGYSFDEIIGKKINILIPEDLQNEEMVMLNKIKNGEFINHYETYRLKKNGDKISVSLTISPIKNNKGQIIGVSKILRDISKQKDIEKKIKQLNEELEQKVVERTAQHEYSLKKLKESDEKFQKAFQASAAGIAITKVSDARFTDVNDAFVRITGFSKDEIIGRTSLELGYIVNAPKREEILKQIREKGRSQFFENTIRSKSGELKEVLSSAETITIDGERLIISVIFDITDRKRAEEDLAKSDALFTSLFELNPAAIAISNIKTEKIIAVNSSFLNLTEFGTKEDVIGKTAIELSILNSPKNREEVIIQLKEGVKTVNIDGEIRTKNGTLKWIATSIIQIEINNEPSLLAVIQDITKRKHAEEQLQNINHELEAFSYSVSHDLRAPLRAINGYSRMLIEDYANCLDIEGQRLLNVIGSNAIKMSVLIDELLDFSRLGRKELKKSSVDMNQLVANISIEIKRNIKHQCVLQINDLHSIEGDSGLLYQVLFNLIYNAIKYSSRIDTPQVEISSLERDGEIIFSISDNGVGFDMVYAEKLFGVFQRLHSQEEFEGVGVGLAIVKRIITKHGGRVWAFSEMNKGATFYFSIPKR